METNGIFGFYINGKYYVVYNHHDSYPSKLGRSIVNEIETAIVNNKLKGWKSRVLKLKIVNDNILVKDSDIIKTFPYHSPYDSNSISDVHVDNWYFLLYKCQGSLNRVIDSGYLYNYVDNNGYPYFSCNIKFTYIVNLDTNQLDYYKYKQKTNSYDFTKLP